MSSTQTTYQPIKVDVKGLTKLKEENNLQIVDAFDGQLKELFVIRNHAFVGVDETEWISSDEFKQFQQDNNKNYFYFYYPWNGHVVKCIGKDDFLELKTNRNRDLITAEEQEQLRNYKVAVFGCSVGSNIAHVITQAGIANEIILADFDELETTNMNRIMAGVHHLGLNKAVIASRKIYEENPYAEVRALTEGVNQDNLEQMLANNEIDCIVEEIDNLSMKIMVRQLAMKHQVPVVMITDNGDGCILHVERYDLGYGKIFDKEVNEWQEVISSSIDKASAAKIIINDIIGGPQNIDPKMMACVPKVVSKELMSWPQLGSAAILGGVAITYAIKQIVIWGNKTPYTREFIKMPDF